MDLYRIVNIGLEDMKFHYDLLIIDLDGVVWRGSKIIYDNVVALKLLNDLNVKLVFASNNSTICRRDYALKLSGILGFEIPITHVFNSGFLVSKWLLDKYGVKRVYPIGEHGLFEELSSNGHIIVDGNIPSEIEVVVVGLDRNLTYKKLEIAHKAITRYNAFFVACNEDHILPFDDWSIPGAGAIVASLIKSTGVHPIVIGKPNPYLAEIILESFNTPKDKILVVGDRCDMDIAFARNAGLDCLLVLTGVSRIEDVEKCKPTYFAEDLLQFIKNMVNGL